MLNRKLQESKRERERDGNVGRNKRNSPVVIIASAQERDCFNMKNRFSRVFFRFIAFKRFSCSAGKAKKSHDCFLFFSNERTKI